MLALKDSLVFAGSQVGGLLMSSDYGFLWTQANSGLIFHNVHCLDVNDSIIFAETNIGFIYEINKANSLEISMCNLFPQTLSPYSFSLSDNATNLVSIGISLSNSRVLF